MENLGSLDVFVRVGESRSFTAVGQQLGISASAVSKAIARLRYTAISSLDSLRHFSLS